MLLKNGAVFIDGAFIKTDIEIKNGVIVAVGQSLTGDDELDCRGKYILPGLVDIHTHGCVGCDFSSATTTEIRKMREYYLKNGITSVLATTVAMSDEDIKGAVATVKEAMSDTGEGCSILGINLEGPYLSPKKCGAHDASLLKTPDLEFVNSLGEEIKLVDLAPEYPTSMDFIKGLGGKVSIAHTACDYDMAMEAISLGADHITHIFNAMDPLHHRKPGVIGAFFDSQAVAEMICDGIHLHPSVLRMMFTAAPERIAVISDSMAATGLTDGSYTLGKLSVFVKEGIATLEDGTLAGSTMNICSMLKKLTDIGVDKEKAAASVTCIPADSVGLGDTVGRIKQGRQADIAVFDSDFTLSEVIFKGKIIDRT